MEEAKAINQRVVKRALAMEGTCTGEHGIGIGKQAYLVEELGEAVELMKDIKRIFDPENLLNPGKVVPL
jgi:D-lactate dehydrogenase (cytochrome)